MLGLFMIMPVFALYAEQLPGATPLLAGLALGVYGLTQALLQIPFGMLSDRIGRKPVIFAGLVIFALGSLVAAHADSIYGIIFGRALQGAGAIASALMALAADLSREEHRTKMMALIGASIGMAFAASMVLGPVVNEWIGLSGIFASTAVLALIGIALLYLVVPDPMDTHFHSDAEVRRGAVADVIADGQLLRLDAGIFTLHFALMCVFLVMPLELRDTAGVDAGDHWKLYLPVFAVSLLLMLPFVIIAERYRRMKQVFVGAIVVLLIAVAGFINSSDMTTLLVSLVLFFAGFNLLEASLPSLISKTAKATMKGTAMGVYSSSQFLGSFAGGVAGGAAHGLWGIDGVYLTVLVAVLLWLLAAVTMRQPRYLSTYLLNVGVRKESEINSLTNGLAAVAGVVEVSVIADEGVAYLKVEKHVLDDEKLLSFGVNKN
ncbi:MAG: MFS transporter [Thiotrichales bacterium]|nr:MAG: MFS transporter [Thiotrichales bacterium]